MLQKWITKQAIPDNVRVSDVCTGMYVYTYIHIYTHIHFFQVIKHRCKTNLSEMAHFLASYSVIKPYACMHACMQVPVPKIQFAPFSSTILRAL